MSIVNAAGNILTKAELTALTTPVVVPDKLKLTAPVYETYTHPGAKQFEGGKRLLYPTGKIVTQKEIDDIYAASNASVSSLTPTSGLAAGNTAVTINGAGFSGVEGVTFGGTPATQVVVVADTKITCRTPAHAVGAVNVVVQDASGDVTKNAAFTYQ
jgi:hypothetical protein